MQVVNNLEEAFLPVEGLVYLVDSQLKQQAFQGNEVERLIVHDQSSFHVYT